MQSSALWLAICMLAALPLDEQYFTEAVAIQLAHKVSSVVLSNQEARLCQPDSVSDSRLLCWFILLSAAFIRASLALGPELCATPIKTHRRFSSTHEHPEQTQRRRSARRCTRGGIRLDLHSAKMSVCPQKQLEHVCRGGWKGDCWRAGRGFFIRHLKSGCWSLLIAKCGLCQRGWRCVLVTNVLPLGVNVDRPCVFSRCTQRNASLARRRHRQGLKQGCEIVQSSHIQMFLFCHD